MSFSASAEQPSGSSTKMGLAFLTTEQQSGIKAGLPWMINPDIKRVTVAGPAVGLKFKGRLVSKRWSFETTNKNLRKVLGKFSRVPMDCRPVSVRGKALKLTENYPAFLARLIQPSHKKNRLFDILK